MRNTKIKRKVVSPSASRMSQLIKKDEDKHKRFKRMKPQEQKIYVKSLMNRSQKKQEIKRQIIDIISTNKNLSLVDIQKKLGLHRNTFNYWIGMLEKEGWFKRQTLKHKDISKKTKLKTLVLNTKQINETKKLSVQHSKNFEDKSFESYTLRSMFIMNILEEIRSNTSYEQHKGLIKLMKEFNKDSSYGAQMIFLRFRFPCVL